MEPTIRGILEQNIEIITSEPYLNVIIHEIERSFPAKTLQDLIFGVIIGYLWGIWSAAIKLRTGKQIIDENQREEFWEMMQKRTLEIKGKITIALNK